MSKHEKIWLEEFSEFVRAEGRAPAEVSARILARVHKDLAPSAWRVFAKLAGVHAVVGTLSLAICDQFGLSPFRTGFSLADYFMKFGESACMVFCGVIFLGLSLLLSRFFLSPEQWRVLRGHAGLEVFGLGMASLGVFAAIGAPLTLAVAALWLAGAMLGGTAAALLPRRPAIA